MQSDQAKSSFKEFALYDEARPFREAFNAQQLSLAEALKVIDKTAKFREWLNGIPPGADVIAEYHRAVNRETVLGKLPGKGARFAAFTGGGAALGISSQLGASERQLALDCLHIDNFILDGLLKGWRPNHFVDTVKKSLRNS